MPVPERQRSSRSSAPICLMLGAFAALLLVAGCVRTASRPAPAPVAAAMASVPDTFVGNDACRGCHAAEFKMHAASRHAMTLHLPSRAALGRSMPPPGRVPGTDIVLGEPQGVLQMTLAGAGDAPLPLDLAFGSGKTGMTYVALMGAEAMELHKSWFPQLRTWYLTPGHERQKPTDIGMLHTAPITRQCVLCHATTLAEGQVKPEPRFFGVGCEACHGAAGAHVAAMQAGKTGELHLERLGSLNAAALNAMCARCHRGEKDIHPGTAQVNSTNRFQPYGLMKSRCFKESGNTLSCLSCHNPHTDAAADPKTYEAVCLKCHSATRPAEAPIAAVAGIGKPCPVNRTGGCIRCHMPARPAFPHAHLPTNIADHYIRVVAKQ